MKELVGGGFMTRLIGCKVKEFYIDRIYEVGYEVQWEGGDLIDCVLKRKTTITTGMHLGVTTQSKFVSSNRTKKLSILC
jgi:hypothetical protein